MVSNFIINNLNDFKEKVENSLSEPAIIYINYATKNIGASYNFGVIYNIDIERKWFYPWGFLKFDGVEELPGIVIDYLSKNENILKFNVNYTVFINRKILKKYIDLFRLTLENTKEKERYIGYFGEAFIFALDKAEENISHLSELLELILNCVSNNEEREALKLEWCLKFPEITKYFV